MYNRKILYAAVTVALLIAAPAVAQARPYGHGGSHYETGGHGMARPGCERMMPSIPQEKQEAFSAATREHVEKIRSIREQLWVKRTTLDVLSRNPKVEPKELTNIIAEMSSLREQLYKERQAHWAKLEKDFGISVPYGEPRFGYGHGPKGGGHRGGSMRYGM